jgi:RNA polymerase sigma-70 factor (ECF subfamily)
MTWPTSMTDEQAMWRVQYEDDHAAFAQLVQRWEAPIQRLCARMTGDLHKAEDLAQEAFTRVFHKRHDFNPTAKFSTWLWRIAINLCHDEQRRRMRRPELSIESTGNEEEDRPQMEFASGDGGPAEAMQALERAEQVRRALMKLPEHYRGVVILRHYENLKFQEIAEVLGIPEGTVKSRMFEGLARLAVLLRDVRNPD